MTVHPPRKDGQLNCYDDGFFHVSTLAGKALAAGGLKACLLAKTGSIVKEYRREFYMPATDAPIYNRVVAITGFTRKYLVEEYKIAEAECTLCYQGTDVKRFFSDPERKEEALRRYPTPEGSFPNFGCIGAYEKRKGQGFLVEAMAAVVKEYPKAFLTLVGKNGRDGDVEGELQAAVKAAGIEANVAFHPFTKEPMYVYEAVDAVVVSSLMEGLPNVLLEGLAMRKPCVSTNIAGCPECVFDGVDGWLCEPSDAASLASAMKKVCAAGRDGCAKLGDAGCDFVNSKMDKNTQFSDFEALFKKIAAEVPA
jgi:glycosyltransferase involved in cell wall biosynthesis